VRGIRDEDLVALELAPTPVIGPDHEDPGQLTLGAGGRLERHGVHAADLGERLLELPEELERPLGRLVGSERMEACEPRQARRPLVQLR
jgi:hypothetical protein